LGPQHYPASGARDGSVMALPTRHIEQPHAVGAHVAERHRFDWFVEAMRCHASAISIFPSLPNRIFWEDLRP
jgi:hypothetical protein